MKKLSVFFGTIMFLFVTIGTSSATLSLIDFDNLAYDTWADDFAVDGVWFETPDWPYGMSVFGNEGYVSSPNALSLNWNYYGAVRSITVTFPSLVNFVQITGGDKSWDTDYFTMAAFGSNGTLLTQTETGHFSGGGEGTHFNDMATISVNAQGIKSVVLSIQSSVNGVAYDNLIYGNVPLPPAVWLFGSGLIGIMGFRNFRKG